VLVEVLREIGVERVYGVPGSQTIELWEALRRRPKPRAIVATNELAASFMAIGEACATGHCGVLLTIPGPGFAYALPGLAEAALDSIPLVHIVGAPAARDDGYALQAIPQSLIAGPFVKRVLTVERGERLESAILHAFSLAAAGEPGPVVLEVTESVMRSGVSRRSADQVIPSAPALPPSTDRLVERLAASRRPILFCGSGAADASELVRELAERLHAPVLTTTSGRGVLSELHPLSLPFDSPGASTAVVNELILAADALLVLGAKLSHNGSFGYSLSLPRDRLLRVDTSVDVLERGYPADVSVVGDARTLAAALLDRIPENDEQGWSLEEIADWRKRLAKAAPALAEPRLAGLPPETVIAAIRRQLPDDTPFTTDSGLHQYLVRRHLSVRATRTLLIPTNFQSMGFGLPAAIGAAAATGRFAVAIIGDGGLAIGGLELMTCVEHDLSVLVIVLSDASFGLIRRQQLRRTGHASGVDRPAIDVRSLATAVGATYVLLNPTIVDSFAAEAMGSGVTIVEVPVTDGPGVGRERAVGLATSALRTLLGPDAVATMIDGARRRQGRSTPQS
jgi:acetolactate synthase I/II/III large subunit